MTKRSQQELLDLLESFRRDIACGRDCLACKFGAKNNNRFFSVTCPINMVDDMLKTRRINKEIFDDMVG